VIKKIFIYFVGGLFVFSLAVQFYSFYSFKSAGSRFTAKDGQFLCEHIKIIETYSKGYRESKAPVITCNFVKSSNDIKQDKAPERFSEQSSSEAFP